MELYTMEIQESLFRFIGYAKGFNEVRTSKYEWRGVFMRILQDTSLIFVRYMIITGHWVG